MRPDRLFVAHTLAEWRERFGAERRSVISVGNFDGLHIGHQQILQAVLECARKQERLAAVITFDPHPLKVLRPEAASPLITTLDQRLHGFDHAGLDAALVLAFDAALSLLPPEVFAQRVLVETVRAGEILVGANFRFGHQHSGDVKLLKKIGAQDDFAVNVIAPVELNGSPVSSTRVRQAVQNGRIEEAAELLGRPFPLTGEIRPGAGRGATLVFPTLNLAPEQDLLPAPGVYATASLLMGKLYRSVTNVGFRPTFDGSGLTIESHLLGFNEQVKSGRLEVRFYKRLREERKFNGPAELREQISRDIATATLFFEQIGWQAPSSSN
jgi:riboflavin kinase/FMN adenylyltransferase